LDDGEENIQVKDIKEEGLGEGLNEGERREL
jgi:hypothetical protein